MQLSFLKKFLLLSTLAVLISTLSAATPALAACDATGAGAGTGILAPFFRVTCNAGLNTGGDVTEARDRLPETLGLIINALLSLTGIVFVILTIYGGFLWMTARGNSSQVEDAEKLIRNSIIGIIVTFSAFSISWFVLWSISNAGL